MRISKKEIWRMVGLLALGLLVWIQTPWPVLEASRNPSHCIHSCNSIRDICRGECDVDCALLYPPGEAFDACVDSCGKVCNDEMQECKLKCAVLRGPPSPTDP